jgi:membrane associated rhomboid family serine protease
MAPAILTFRTIRTRLTTAFPTTRSPQPGWCFLNFSSEPGGEPIPYGKQQARAWMLVLASRRIPCQQFNTANGYFLLVPSQFLATAREQLELYQRENQNWPPPLPRLEPLYENQLATLFIFILLCGFANVTELETVLRGWPHLDWQQLGSARAGLIVAGEWWRTATALTLHAGALHLAGNVVFGILLVGRLARDLGSGLAWSLVLTAGMGGNYLNALLQSPQHTAVGASTAVFGAVGILAGLNLVRYRKPLWRRWALPLAGAFALLAMVGAGGEQTDLGAHLFGLLTGIGLGAGCGCLLVRYGRPGPWLNRLLGLAAALTVAGAWSLALHSVI